MDHNQTITDLYLQKYLATEPRIIAADLYAAIQEQLNPKLELAEFRLELSAWFKPDGPLNNYTSSKGRFGGIKLRSEEDRIAGSGTPKAPKPASDSSSIGLESDSANETEDDSEGLTVYITPSIRLYQPDTRQWAIQRRNGEVWVSQYYQNSLDNIINSFIRHAMNKEFTCSPAKISDLKELVKVVKGIESNLIESFKAILVEKTNELSGEKAA